MGLWFSTPRRRDKAGGKFAHVPVTGLQRAGSLRQGDWSYDLVRHQTGVTVRRTVYSVAIKSPVGSRAAYLSNFSTVALATAAAEEWIKQAKAKLAITATAKTFGPPRRRVKPAL